jgi:hypothetical protein
VEERMEEGGTYSIMRTSATRMTTLMGSDTPYKKSAESDDGLVA